MLTDATYFDLWKDTKQKFSQARITFQTRDFGTKSTAGAHNHSGDQVFELKKEIQRLAMELDDQKRLFKNQQSNDVNKNFEIK